jgi:hypothetical protein
LFSKWNLWEFETKSERPSYNLFSYIVQCTMYKLYIPVCTTFLKNPVPFLCLFMSANIKNA